MRHIAAYLLLVLGGNESPSADDVKKVLSSAGVEVDEDRLSKLLSSLEGKVRDAGPLFPTLHLLVSARESLAAAPRVRASRSPSAHLSEP